MVKPIYEQMNEYQSPYTTVCSDTLMHIQLISTSMDA